MTVRFLHGAGEPALKMARLAVLAVAMVPTSGCIAWYGAKLPVLEESHFRPTSCPDAKPRSLLIKPGLITNTAEPEAPTILKDPEFSKRFVKAAKASGLFSEVTTDPERSSEVTHRITTELNYKNPFWGQMWVMAASYTALLIPGYSFREAELRTTLETREGKILKQYRHLDGMHTFWHLLALPVFWMSFSAPEKEQVNLSRNVFADIAKDGLLCK